MNRNHIPSDREKAVLYVDTTNCKDIAEVDKILENEPGILVFRKSIGIDADYSFLGNYRVKCNWHLGKEGDQQWMYFWRHNAWPDHQKLSKETINWLMQKGRPNFKYIIANGGRISAIVDPSGVREPLQMGCGRCGKPVFGAR